MSKKNPYQSFSKYVLRTPLFSVSSFKLFTSKKNITDEDFRKLFNNDIISEAIFLASPLFYEEIKRWLNEEIQDKKKKEKIKLSTLKYISRMSSRCTPFGLFAGCGIGEFGENTMIELSGAIKNDRHTRLDMNYLVALSQDLVKNEAIRKQLLFTPNSSIYSSGNQLRYIEYKYFNSKREHQIVAVNNSEYLNLVLRKASEGAKLEDLAKVLVDDKITIEEANEFIKELVSSQLLVSNLEPSVSGPEFLKQICSVLEKMNNVDDILIALQKGDEKISAIDHKIGNNPKEYIKLSKFLEKLETSFDMKFLFQSDMILNCTKNTISRAVIDNVKKGIKLFNKITIPPQKTLLSEFKEAFYERYEEREVLLSNALDVEIGIGYKQNQNSGDFNPLIDNLILPKKTSKYTTSDIKWTPINLLFQNILFKALKENAYTITLDANDFKDLEENWDNLPDTFSSMVQLILENGKEKIKISDAGASSAANLLGRFCHGDEKLYDFTKEIISTETAINKDQILAEIIHLPESRVGNILMRPDLRDYEIPYLAKSIKPKEKQLPINDLMISVKNNRKIFLRSKKQNKEVIPHLTNAHNYSGNDSLPIYHFLSDMQTQTLRGGISLNLGPFASEYEFLPRIEYLNLILHNATWNLKKRHIVPLINALDKDEHLVLAIKIFREQLKMPPFVMLAEGDNELLVNFDNLTSVKMLLNIVSKRTSFKLIEFLFANEGIVKEGNEYYANQVVISFYNEQKLKNSKTKNDV